MASFLKTLLCFCIGILFLPIKLHGQIFNNTKINELSNHFFGLDYFPASWQGSIFEDEFYSSKFYKKNVEREK